MSRPYESTSIIWTRSKNNIHGYTTIFSKPKMNVLIHDSITVKDANVPFLFVISSRFCFQQGNTVSTLVESSGGGRAGRLPLKTQQRQGSSKAPRNCRLPTTRTQTAMVHLEQPQPRDRRPGQASPLKAREANPDRDTKRREAVPGVTNQSSGGATRQRRTLGGESSTGSRAVRVTAYSYRKRREARPGFTTPSSGR